MKQFNVKDFPKLEAEGCFGTSLDCNANYVVIGSTQENRRKFLDLLWKSHKVHTELNVFHVVEPKLLEALYKLYRSFHPHYGEKVSGYSFDTNDFNRHYPNSFSQDLLEHALEQYLTRIGFGVTVIYELGSFPEMCYKGETNSFSLAIRYKGEPSKLFITSPLTKVELQEKYMQYLDNPLNGNMILVELID
jgi:hypothetical protein